MIFFFVFILKSVFVQCTNLKKLDHLVILYTSDLYTQRRNLIFTEMHQNEHTHLPTLPHSDTHTTTFVHMHTLT